MSLDRYTLPAMRYLWSTEHRLEMWRAVASAQAAARTGNIHLLKELMGYPCPTADQMRDTETLVRHDVVAFLTLWREQMVPEHAREVHLGLTSSDLVDTATSATLARVTDQIFAVGNRLQVALAKKALQHWDLERLGRTHGQPAEVTTLGYQLARHATSINSDFYRLDQVMSGVLLFKMSGPVGTFRYTTVEQETAGANILGDTFSASGVASQRLPREEYARWVSELAILASSLEDLALQIRLGQQFGVEELSEPFGSDQVGSSSMPHKRNPIRSENLSGLARLVRAQVVPVMEGIPTWSERDISHSSVERVALQTASTLVHYMLSNALVLVEQLEVHPTAMRSNIDRAGHMTHSAAYKVELVKAGVAPNQVDWLVDTAIRERNVGPEIFMRMGPEWAEGKVYEQPPMRVDHARKLMEEIIHGASD